MQQVIQHEHVEIHQGDMFTYYDLNEGVANNATVTHLIQTGDKDVHIVFEISGDVAMKSEFFELPTTSANGTLQTSVFNRNRNSAKTATCKWYKTPTVTSDGTRIAVARSGTVSASSRIGGDQRSAYEWVLKRNTKYLNRVTSLSGASGSLNFSMRPTWYEE